MKQIKNRKNILKATIAVTALLLAGCVDSSVDDIYAKYGYYDSDDETLHVVEQDNVEIVDDDVSCSVKRSTKKEEVPAVSLSYMAEPDIVPVKPKCTKKCSAKAKESKKASVSPAASVEIQQKPSQAAVGTEKAKIVTTTTETVEVKPATLAVKTEVVEITQEEKEWAQREAERMRAEEEENLRKEQEAARLKAEEEAKLREAEAARLKAEAEEKLRLQREQEAAAEKLLLDDSLNMEQEDVIIDESLNDTVSVKTVQGTVKEESCGEVKDWVASEGATLRALLMEWGDKAGWRIIWNMDRDYTLQASAVFRGRFVDVAAALLRSFARATPAPKGVFYKGNKVLVVSTREDENAD